MVKERKAQFGATNLSARSDVSNHNETTTGPTKFYRSWTHKLVSPDEYHVRDPNQDKLRSIANTATWLPQKIYSRDFNSTSTTSFRDPRTVPVKVKKVRTTQEIEEQNALVARQRESVTSMCKLATKCFGTTSAMLKSFNKRGEDTISEEELGEYLRRHKLADYLDEHDRRLIFDAVDPKHNGTVAVSALLKTAEEQEFHESEHKKDMMKIRDFLAQHVAQNRAAKAAAAAPSQTHEELDAIKKKKGIENEAQLMKLAVGTKTFDLDISPQEMQGIISAVFDKFPNDESQRKFARFLKMSNVNLGTIPFYDMRSEHLDKLKHRAATIERDLHSEELQTKFADLSQTRWRGSLTTLRESPLHSHKEEGSGVMQLSQSMPSLSLSPSPTKVPTSGRRLLDTLPPKQPRNLLLSSAKGLDIDEGAQSVASRASSSLLDGLDGGGSTASPTKALRALKLKEELFAAETGPGQASDFYVQVVDSGVSMGRMKDSSKVVRIEKIDSLEVSAHGRRAKDHGATDWSRVGVGGRAAEDEEASRFATSNSTFFTPLVYEPSQPVARHSVSEAELAVQKRNYRRQQRHERTAANMSVTATRLEYDAMEKGMRAMRNEHSRVVDSIRYETAMLLNDLQCYKKQPLQRMNRKPNLTLADKMWGGNQEAQTVVLVPENRDFNTTYNTSFQSSALITPH